MKINLLLISIFVTLTTLGQTSVYHPFPDSAAVWNIDSHVPCGLYFDTWENQYSYILTGDTTIKNNNYHKLVIPTIVTISNGSCDTIGTWTYTGYYAGGIRQDIPNKKVFFIPPSDTTEQLLYDFNMQVGDTVKGYTETLFGQTDIVQSIDSVLVGNTYRKQWNINPCYNIHLIEGIGSTFGLIQYSPGCLTDGPNYSITCFQQNGQPQYPSTSTYCELITSINSVKYISSRINIFPNPSNGSFVIELEKAYIKEVRLYDLLGNIIFSQQINNQTSFHIDNLRSGAYILTAIDKEDRVINRKVISSP